MWKCPICSVSEQEQGKCKNCGFDKQEDFLEYRTLTPVDRKQQEKFYLLRKSAESGKASNAVNNKRNYKYVLGGVLGAILVGACLFGLPKKDASETTIPKSSAMAESSQPKDKSSVEKNSAEESPTESSITEETPAEEADPTDSPSPAFHTEELRVNIWGTDQTKKLQQIADEWTEQTGVRVVVNDMTQAEYWETMENAQASGEMPDVFWLNAKNAEKWMDSGQVLDLSDYLAQDSEMDLGSYYPELVSLYQKDGRQFAVPKDHDTIALLYNKEIFDRYGLEYPDDTWTWENLQEAAQQITEAGSQEGVYGCSMNIRSTQDGWYNVLASYGVKLITEDQKGTEIGSDRGKEAMEQVRKILTVSIPQSLIDEKGQIELFQDGKIAMMLRGSWEIIKFYRDPNREKYGWAMVPFADTNQNGVCDAGERSCMFHGLGWAVSSACEDTDAAYSLVAYLTSEEGQRQQSELGTCRSGRTGSSEGYEKAYEGMDISAFSRIEEEGLELLPHSRNTSAWESAIKGEGAFLDAWLTPEDSEKMAEACENAQKLIEQVLAEEK